MGTKPEGFTLDRVDPEGNYEPGNCRWVDLRSAAHRKSDVKTLTHEGKTLTLKQWAEKKDIRIQCLYDRLKRNWSVEDTLDTPVRKFRRQTSAR
jgi:hypothetical protein